MSIRAIAIGSMSMRSACTIAGTVMGSTSIASTSIAGNVGDGGDGAGDGVGDVLGPGSLTFATSTAGAGRVITGVVVFRGRKSATINTQAAAAGTSHTGCVQIARRGAAASRTRAATRSATFASTGADVMAFATSSMIGSRSSRITLVPVTPAVASPAGVLPKHAI